MKHLAKWFVPFLIGALVAPTFVGCDDSDVDDPITTTPTTLAPSEQQSKLQQIATDAINSIDVSSTEPILAALDYMIDRLNGVELPEELEDFVEEFESQEDVAVEDVYVEDVYVEGSGEDVYESVYVGDDEVLYDSDSTYYEGDDEVLYDSDSTYYAGDDEVLYDSDSTYYTDYDEVLYDYDSTYYASSDSVSEVRSSSAFLVKQLMSMSSIASGDMATLANYATAATEEFSYLTYASDIYGIYTLNANDTWTTTASSDTFAFVVDGYTLSIKPSGSMYVTFPSEWDFEDVAAVTIPTSATVELSYNGSTLMSVSMNISELNTSSYIFTSTASASVADFATTVNINISNSASSATGVMTYNGNTIVEVAAGVDNINIQSSINSESLIATGGVTSSIKLFDSALCLTGSVVDLSGYIAAEEANDDAYPYFSTDDRSYDNAADEWIYNYTWGYDEAMYSNFCSIWNQYINIYWGFGSTSDVQGSVEYDYEYEPKVVTNSNYIYTSYYGEYIPILVFEDGSRIAIDSFFSESAFETTINSAIDLANDMTSLISRYNLD